ncbi:hypothetical protein V2J56_09200 [Georgenia sp. MJ206]|uniref:phage tail tube protein n=1 Tax=Georgenia wangjunii TaxID=3117730 RepID=UPI002F26268B
MPYTAADGRQKVTVLEVQPDDLKAITATAANAGTDIQDHILKTDFRLSATASATHTDTPLGAKGTWNNLAESNAEGNVNVIRDLDDEGRPVVDSEAATVWDLFREKGTLLTVMVRNGPDPDEDWAAGDEYSVFVVETDNPQEQADRAGWIKHPIPLGVKEFELFQTLAAGTP